MIKAFEYFVQRSKTDQWNTPCFALIKEVKKKKKLVKYPIFSSSRVSKVEGSLVKAIQTCL